MSCSRRLFLSAIAWGTVSGGRPAAGMLWQREASRATTDPQYGDLSSHELLSAARPWLDPIIPQLTWVAAAE